jgi:DNA-binding transcriptional ArsR family regulator
MPGAVASEDELGRKLAALSFAERRALLEVLLGAHRDGGEGMTITALAAATEANRFTASRQLAALRDAGFVRVRRDGTRRLHSIDLCGILMVDDWLLPFVDAALERPAVAESPPVGVMA